MIHLTIGKSYRSFWYFLFYHLIKNMVDDDSKDEMWTINESRWKIDTKELYYGNYIQGPILI